ncbi:MAG: hypothetical protein KUG82_13815 [Pseudomonadales bacterium]|nr:hypothetical protein [Pseudomonadales bacterium]
MNKNVVAILVVSVFSLLGCKGDGEAESDNSDGNHSELGILQGLVFPENNEEGLQGNLRPEELGTTYNPEAVIPPQCYTKHEGQYNPCMTCHQTYPYKSRPNQMNDGGLQREYAFSDLGTDNHWLNLFEDRTEAMAQITDQQVIDYIYTDNYTPLIAQLKAADDWEGPVPNIENLQRGEAAFDEQGFALDGSGWVAFNYKPLPSTFWPTNGSTDDVMIRLPALFQTSSCDTETRSRDTYLANLSILETTIKKLDSISTPPIDENKVCADLNGDGVMSVVEAINQQEIYVGDANVIETTEMLYPLGTEFLHTVRYVGINSDGGITIPARMKEVRYMEKVKFLAPTELISRYGKERQEKIDELLPKYIHRGDKGTDNTFGWMVQGFIEAEDGHLRKQSEEEHLFCMGCHSTIGTTIDDTFAFPRKITGAKGWKYISLKGMEDAPTMNGSAEGEIEHYLRTVGGGNEFRENTEIAARFYNDDGTLNEDALAQATDVYDLITPGIRRALDLNKAYMTIVKEQDFIHGRDANLGVAKNVYESVDNNTPVLPEENAVPWDIRLNWEGDSVLGD